MADLTLTYSAELEVTQVEGNSSPGIAFVDRWLQEEMAVLDAGRIIVRGTEALQRQALAEGLTVELERVVSER